jgi:hypothetical protein
MRRREHAESHELRWRIHVEPYDAFRRSDVRRFGALSGAGARTRSTERHDRLRSSSCGKPNSERARQSEEVNDLFMRVLLSFLMLKHKPPFVHQAMLNLFFECAKLTRLRCGPIERFSHVSGARNLNEMRFTDTDGDVETYRNYSGVTGTAVDSNLGRQLPAPLNT